MEKLITTKVILKALYTCASKEEVRVALSGFFILPDRRVYSTDGRRLVVVTHPCFDKFEAGNYEFQGKPVYNKSFGEIIIQRSDNAGPDISLILNGQYKAKLFTQVFTEDKKAKALEISKLLYKIAITCKTCFNYAILDFFPEGEGFDLFMEDLNNPGGYLYFKLVAGGDTTMEGVICPVRLNVK